MTRFYTYGIHCFGAGLVLGMLIGAGIFVLVWRFAA
jgi:hypothetical protein